MAVHDGAPEVLYPLVFIVAFVAAVVWGAASDHPSVRVETRCTKGVPGLNWSADGIGIGKVCVRRESRRCVTSGGQEQCGEWSGRNE